MHRNRSIIRRSAPAFAAVAAALALTCGPGGSANDAPDGPANDGVVTGTVESERGPEAGVWVVAETDDLDTRFTKIVVTNDEGLFALPELPDGSYDVWVRGYGLVDSSPVAASPGDDLTLRVALAPTEREAAEVYPADSWYALLEVPEPHEFPGTGEDGNGISPGVETQGEWIDGLKQGCQLCHQMGNEYTREVAHMNGVEGLSFESTADAWDYRVRTGIRGAAMYGRWVQFGPRVVEEYADWTDRIAAGEVPPEPPRPSGEERNVVITMWDWGEETSYIHDEMTTDKRDPTVNAGGPVYGHDSGHGEILAVDPNTHTASSVTIPVREDPENEATSRFRTTFAEPSLAYGDSALWTAPADPHNPMMDARGRLWNTSRVRGPQGPVWCDEDSSNEYAQYFPYDRSGRQVSYYDPETGEFVLIDTCFGTHHLQFAEDEAETLYFSNPGGRGVIGWLDTRTYDETGDDERSQGWCPTVVDTNGDGRITKPWNELTDFDDPAAIDPELDTWIAIGSYGIIPDPTDPRAVWFAATGDLSSAFPGRIARLHVGDDPPESCITEVYQPPGDFENPDPLTGFGPRGIDIDREGLVWTALSGSSQLASFDRDRCPVLSGPETVDGTHCEEGWTLYPTDGPKLKGTEVPADFHYYNWVDQFNTLGLGENVPIATGSGSDALLALLPDEGRWVTLRVPYPLGFYARGLDGRIDDPAAGWKGRGLWANYGTNALWHLEGGMGSRSKIVHFQLRPDPLAR